MKDSEMQEYLKLKAEKEYREWMTACQKEHQKKLDESYQKDVQKNIEYMESNGTLKMGKM